MSNKPGEASKHRSHYKTNATNGLDNSMELRFGAKVEVETELLTTIPDTQTNKLISLPLPLKNLLRLRGARKILFNGNEQKIFGVTNFVKHPSQFELTLHRSRTSQDNMVSDQKISRYAR